MYYVCILWLLVVRCVVRLLVSDVCSSVNVGCGECSCCVLMVIVIVMLVCCVFSVVCSCVMRLVGRYGVLYGEYVISGVCVVCMLVSRFVSGLGKLGVLFVMMCVLNGVLSLV